MASSTIVYLYYQFSHASMLPGTLTSMNVWHHILNSSGQWPLTWWTYVCSTRRIIQYNCALADLKCLDCQSVFISPCSSPSSVSGEIMLMTRKNEGKGRLSSWMFSEQVIDMITSGKQTYRPPASLQVIADSERCHCIFGETIDMADGKCLDRFAEFSILLDILAQVRFQTDSWSRCFTSHGPDTEQRPRYDLHAVVLPTNINTEFMEKFSQATLLQPSFEDWHIENECLAIAAYVLGVSIIQKETVSERFSIVFLRASRLVPISRLARALESLREDELY